MTKLLYVCLLSVVCFTSCSTEEVLDDITAAEVLAASEDYSYIRASLKEVTIRVAAQHQAFAKNASSALEGGTDMDALLLLGYTESQSELKLRELLVHRDRLFKLKNEYGFSDTEWEEALYISVDAVSAEVIQSMEVSVNNENELTPRCICDVWLHECIRGAVGSFYWNALWNTLGGASTGAWIGGPIGATAGGLIGFYSSVWQYNREFDGCFMSRERCYNC